MSLWSLHPKYFDKQGLMSLWREGLAVQKMLAEDASLQKPVPMFEEFKKSSNPIKAIGSYLSMVASEGARQGYKLNHERILCPNFDAEFIEIKPEQIIFEMDFLKSKLKQRDVKKYYETAQASSIDVNPVFSFSKKSLHKYSA